ncbi:hypothetical protein [Caldilinea sp.]|uniref:hypothetical protein n=1 Tax=Caldilinea sp. TaxID=2293560 RepID=UPI002B7AC456|nr:hypothetical protein [Anaerolineales bacterium]HQY93639.1 hypothetical protein [Caldilinea sp.]HRA67758.1 hypothetical protein [Caldilinea sp.]
MADEGNAQRAPEEAAVYCIQVKGQLGAEWSDWFDGLAIMPAPHGDTLLIGPVADQSALHGLLRKVRDLGLPLLAVNLVVGSQEGAFRDPG